MGQTWVNRPPAQARVDLAITCVQPREKFTRVLTQKSNEMELAYERKFFLRLIRVRKCNFFELFFVEWGGHWWTAPPPKHRSIWPSNFSIGAQPRDKLTGFFTKKVIKSGRVCARARWRTGRFGHQIWASVLNVARNSPDFQPKK